MNFAKLKESTVASISKGRATASHYLAEKSNKAIEIILKDLSCLNDILKTLNCRVENASLIMKSAGLPEISVDIDRGEGLDVNALEAAAGDGERSVGVRAALKALLLVHKHFKPSPQVYKALFDHGLIIFRYDIWRICNYRRTPSSDGRVPWKGRYVIFSDVYTALPNLILLHSMHGARPVFKRKWTRSTMRVGDVDVNTPDLASSKAFLARVYGRYMTVKMEFNWKSRVRAQAKSRRL